MREAEHEWVEELVVTDSQRDFSCAASKVNSGLNLTMDISSGNDSVSQIRTTLFEQEPQICCCWYWSLLCWLCCKKQMTYRIPALIYISEKQTYLAFAEKRKSPYDTDADILVMRKGIWKAGGVEWDSEKELTKAYKQGFRSMNPCPIYERETKTLFLFFISIPVGVSEIQQINERKNQARLCFVKSSDPYEEWSEMIDFTDQEEIKENEKNWATVAVGPGHGVQMKNGRLIIPAYAYHLNTNSTPISYAFAIYSDDTGKTWKIGSKLGQESGECQMAEIIDDQGNSKLYCNARTTIKRRLEALSESSGEDFEQTALSETLIDTGEIGCHGSVLNIPSSDQDQKTWLVHSHPINETNRAELSISVNKSPWDFKKWEKPLTINEGPSGYSDLAECEDRNYIACLTECGQKKEIEQIVFILFTL